MSEAKDGGVMWIGPDGRPQMILTLRDWFAGKALEGIFHAFHEQAARAYDLDEVARRAYEMADTMLAARTQKGGGEG